ncbi:hypothetical protein BJ742DRAFT_810447 [Cladochytrium replicatum]|nr:hypothetical protein BJ742DRAFT_810447 [Cladochytrium replicatum]
MDHFVEVPVLLDDAIPADNPDASVLSFQLPSPAGLDPAQSGDGAPLTQIGSVYYFRHQPRSFLLWRLLSNRRVLELRRVFVANVVTDPKYSDQLGMGAAMRNGGSLKGLPDTSNSCLPVHFSFPHPILTQPTFFEESESGDLHLMLITTAGTFYRLQFPPPDFLYHISSLAVGPDGLLYPSIGRDGPTPRRMPSEFYTMYQIRAFSDGRQNSLSGVSGGQGTRLTPVISHFPDLDTILVGCVNGSLLLVFCPRAEQQDNNYIEHELHEQSYVNSLLTNIVQTPMNLLMNLRRRTGALFDSEYGQSAPTEVEDVTTLQPISIASIVKGNQTLAFVMCRDRKLRIWNLNAHNLVKSVPLDPIMHGLSFDSRVGSGGLLPAIFTSASSIAATPSPAAPGLLTSSFTNNGPVALLPPNTGNFCQIFDAAFPDLEDLYEEPSEILFRLALYLVYGDGGSGASRALRGNVGDPLFILCEGRITTSGTSVVLDELRMIDRRECNSMDEISADPGKPSSAGRTASDSSLDDILIDFKVVPKVEVGLPPLSSKRRYTLWALWDRRKESIFRYTHLSVSDDSGLWDIPSEDEQAGDNDGRFSRQLGKWNRAVGDGASEFLGSRWVSVQTRSRQPIEIPDLEYHIQSKGLKKAFLDHIFSPGRFSPSVLGQALRIYANGRDRRGGFSSRGYGGDHTGNSSFEAILEKIKNANWVELWDLASELFDATTVQVGALAGGEPQRSQEDEMIEYTRFWTLCVQLHSAENQPAGCGFDAQSGQISIVKRGCFSVLRTAASVEVLQGISDGVVDEALYSLLPPAAFVIPLPALTPTFSLTRGSIRQGISHDRLASKELRAGIVSTYARLIDFTRKHVTRAQALEMADELCRVILVGSPLSLAVEDLARGMGYKYFPAILDDIAICTQWVAIIGGPGGGLENLLRAIVRIIRDVEEDPADPDKDVFTHVWKTGNAAASPKRDLKGKGSSGGSSLMEVESNEETPGAWLARTNTSTFSDSCIATSFCQIAETRFNAALDFFVVIILAVSLGRDASATGKGKSSSRQVNDEPFRVPSDVVGEALVVLQSSYILWWLCTHRVSRGSSSGTVISETKSEDDSLQHQFSAMKVNVPDVTRKQGSRQMDSLPFYLLRNHYMLDIDMNGFIGEALEQLLHLSRLLRIGTTRFTSRLGILSVPETIEEGEVVGRRTDLRTNVVACTVRGVVKLARKLDVYASSDEVVKGMSGGALNEVVRALLEMVPKVAASWYLLAKTCVRANDPVGAQSGFEKAGGGVIDFARGSRDKREDVEYGRDLIKLIVPPDVMNLVGYYRHVGRVFEEKGWDEGALSFARMALEIMLAKSADSDGSPGAMVVDSEVGDFDIESPALQIRTLRKKVFHHSLNMKRYQDSYVSMIAIDDPEIRRDCLRRLVSVLCENHEIDLLCSRFAFVGLHSEVEYTLRFKARNSAVYPIPAPPPLKDSNKSPTSPQTLPAPNYHRILYAYYIFRQDFKKAAVTMYQYARRLMAVMPSAPGKVGTRQDPSQKPGYSMHDVKTEQARGLLAAIHALSNVEEDERWILITAMESSTHESGRLAVKGGINDQIRKKRRLDFGNADDDSIVDGTVTEDRSTSSSRVVIPSSLVRTTARLPTTVSLLNGPAKNPIVQVSDLRREYALCLSQLDLAAAEADSGPQSKGASIGTTFAAIAGLPDPGDAVSMYLSARMYNKALSLALLFKADLTSIFEAVASKCVELSAADNSSRTAVESSWFSAEESLSSTAVESGASTRAWRLLQIYLENHDTKERGYGYHRAAVERILQLNRKVELPPWLVEVYKAKRGPEDLIRVYMKYDLMEAAGRVAVDHVLKSIPAKTLLPTVAARWLPIGVLDRLLNVLEARCGDEFSEAVTSDIDSLKSRRDGKLTIVLNQLRESVAYYYDVVQAETNGLVASM